MADALIGILFALAQAAAGWYVADLFSALFHLSVDRMPHRLARLPVLRTLHTDFQGHHLRPGKMLHNGFWENSWHTFLGGLLVLVVFWPWPWFAVPCALGTILCQEAHRYSHKPGRGRLARLARLLQRLRFTITPQTHGAHHDPSRNFARDYGILNGWSNPLLNRTLDMPGK